LDVATTFDGGETVVEYDKGQEHVHAVQASLPLLAYTADQIYPTLHVAGYSCGLQIQKQKAAKSCTA
jgi:N-formylglutamate amidohydrolase